MPATTLDLHSLNLSHGEGRRIKVPIAIGTIELGGQSYEPNPANVEAGLEISRTASGFAIRMAFPLRLEGPCMRCLGAATIDVEVEAREVDQLDGIDPELRSPYVDPETGELDAGRWAHDAALLELPSQILCMPDCPGLCQVCGETLKGADPDAHRHGAEIDPRWAKLSDLDLGS